MGQIETNITTDYFLKVKVVVLLYGKKVFIKFLLAIIGNGFEDRKLKVQCRKRPHKSGKIKNSILKIIA